MKVEFELPELPGYEYTGEFRPPVKGEVCPYFGKPVREQEKYDGGNVSYPIMRVKAKPRIVIYQWLINHNTNFGKDEFDCGHTVVYATEDNVTAKCTEFGWTFKKFNPSPLWSLDGDAL
jgi:hypothetical protein